MVAVKETVSPLDAPGTENVGVVSEVTLSADDDPESELAARSGDDRPVGEVESTVSEIAADVDSFPASSRFTDVSDHTPSVSAGRVQLPAVTVHSRVVPSLLARTIVEVPAAPETLMSGVLSDVMSSVDDEPESDDAARSGAPGIEGAVASIVNDNAGVPAKDTFPAGSVSVADTLHVPSANDGDRSHELAEPTV